jgi:hypothetical protein
VASSLPGLPENVRHTPARVRYLAKHIFAAYSFLLHSFHNSIDCSRDVPVSAPRPIDPQYTPPRSMPRHQALRETHSLQEAHEGEKDDAVGATKTERAAREGAEKALRERALPTERTHATRLKPKKEKGLRHYDGTRRCPSSSSATPLRGTSGQNKSLFDIWPQLSPALEGLTEIPQ